MASDLLATGKTTFPDGRELAVEDFRDYLELIKWVYKHIDGDPPKSLEVSGANGGSLRINMSWGEEPPPSDQP